MARTQAADYDDRREAILDKAAELYATSGFLGSSIADLAVACGMSKSLLYHYFSSKDDILFQIMDGHISVLRLVVAEVENEADPERKLASLTHRFMELYVDASARHKVLVNDLDKLPEAQRQQIVVSERQLIAMVETIIAALSPPLADNPEKCRAAAMLYFGMINWTHTWFNADGPMSGQEVADLALHIFLQGLPR
ncbi:TetR/AcrR family transcriptional regulator [Sphingomonas sp. KC8]|uniref:TetR/AcrR family transcriptional regulator n=1 Tax=Sphingomonas sp. KC8 TaxID=1030157 RepID=UPI000248A088|nr:TetR/AcrR family transcriptional regulator [Sphingomonas sp. KC8]ARS27696.1 TetR family transcriptional regulator [Sphingomonas sp. KC8]